MTADRTITITGKDRPALFRDMLVSLRANDLAGWRIVIAIDGDRVREFADIAREHLHGADYTLSGNSPTLGIKLNPFRLLSRVFSEGSRLNLYLEEDLLLSPDATRLALWYERHYRPGWACLNLVSGPCGSAGFLSNPAYPDVLFEAHSFNSLGFVARSAEWFGIFKPVWMGADASAGEAPRYAEWRTHWGWDWSIHGVIADGDLVSVQPAFARATHQGGTGTYCTEDFQARAFGAMQIQREADIDYRLHDRAGLPHPLRSHLHLQEEVTARLIELERGRATC